MARKSKAVAGEREILFRRWLIDKLKVSRWPRERESSFSEMGKLIGVQPDVLEQAQRELDAESKSRGMAKQQIGAPQRRRVTRRKVEVQLPLRVYEDWIAYCKHRGMGPAVLLRGLVHDLLSGPKQPSKLQRKCLYRGKTYGLEGSEHGKKWKYMAKTDVSEGAARALTQRAVACGSTVAGLLRGLILDLLEGRVKKITIISDARAMFDDETRYWTLKE